MDEQTTTERATVDLVVRQEDGSMGQPVVTGTVDKASRKVVKIEVEADQLTAISERLAAMEGKLVNMEARLAKFTLTEAARLRLAGRGRKATFLADAEVVTAIEESVYRGLSLKAIHAALVERFGDARAPSRSAIGRYRMKLLAPPKAKRRRLR